MADLSESKDTGMRGAPLPDDALAQIFNAARTHSTWLDREVPDSLLHRLVDTLKLGPTSANCSPARLVFVKSPAAKAALAPHMSEGNRAKTLAAPVTAIIGQDFAFYEYLPKLYPFTDARAWFAGNEEKIRETAFRNATLQGAYLIIAARALGLDCGPMSGFDPAGVDAAFFAGTETRTNFLCNLGYGDSRALKGRAPRFAFDEMARIV